MDHKDALQIVRDSFAHIVVERIVIEHDPLIDGDVVKVIVREDKLSEALRGNGEYVRRAAMQSGFDVEVILESE